MYSAEGVPGPPPAAVTIELPNGMTEQAYGRFIAAVTTLGGQIIDAVWRQPAFPEHSTIDENYERPPEVSASYAELMQFAVENGYAKPKGASFPVTWRVLCTLATSVQHANTPEVISVWDRGVRKPVMYRVGDHTYGEEGLEVLRRLPLRFYKPEATENIKFWQLDVWSLHGTLERVMHKHKLPNFDVIRLNLLADFVNVTLRPEEALILYKRRDTSETLPKQVSSQRGQG
jgi:hypothetical protein